jgi:uncharacterized delta-60 repeat protein
MKKPTILRTMFLIGSVSLQLSTFSFASHGAPGDVDLSFDPGSGVNGRVTAVALQPDGKLIIGGWFSMVKGLIRAGIARLNADGTGDATFVPPRASIDRVTAVVLQPDGKVLVGLGTGITRLNSDGTLDATFIVLTLTGEDGFTRGVNAIALQADGKILIGGDFQVIGNGFRYGIARLNADGTLDGSFDHISGTGLTGIVNCIGVQADGKVLIGGYFWGYDGVYRPGLARLNTDGSLDTSFDPGLDHEEASVYSITVQPDGNVVFGGAFLEVHGSSRNSIARVNGDGSLDESFNPGSGPNDSVFAITLQPDGKVLIGGLFRTVVGTPRNRIARLNANGSLDGSFDTDSADRPEVFALALQPDGKVVVGGRDLLGTRSTYDVLVRLTTDGSRDNTFIAGGGIEGAVTSMIIQPDGKLVVGGSFRFINGKRSRLIARLNVDGSLDSSFALDPLASGSRAALQPDGKVLLAGGSGGIARVLADGSLDPSFNTGTGFDGGAAYAMTLQPDGKVLVAGNFDTVNGATRRDLARLNSDGSLDTGFDPPYGSGSIYAIAQQADGKVLVGGGFFLEGDSTIRRLARLNVDGSVDSSFQHVFFTDGSGGEPVAIVLQSDGKILMAGYFDKVHGVNRRGIARLNPNGTLDPTFDAGLSFTFSEHVSLGLQQDGKIVVGGNYFLGSRYIRGVSRLNSNGSQDETFNPGADAGVFATVFQPDGKMLIAGGFTQFGEFWMDGVVRPYVARLYGDFIPPLPSLTIARADSSVIISWPTGATGVGLFESTNLSNSCWSPVAQSMVTNGSQISVTVPTSAGSKFFRLKSPPVAPQLIADSVEAGITLSWTAFPGATGHHVQRATNSSGPYTTIAYPSTTNYTDTTVEVGTAYYYIVSVIYPCGESATSYPVSRLPLGGPAIFVESITMSFVAQGSQYKTRAVVRIVDNTGAPYSGVTVTGNFSGSINNSGSTGVTDASGAVITSSSTIKNGTVTFTVTGVAGNGVTYKPSANVVTSATISR